MTVLIPRQPVTLKGSSECLCSLLALATLVPLNNTVWASSAHRQESCLYPQTASQSDGTVGTKQSPSIPASQAWRPQEATVILGLST